jgi:hypothetical protein
MRGTHHIPPPPPHKLNFTLIRPPHSNQIRSINQPDSLIYSLHSLTPCPAPIAFSFPLPVPPLTENTRNVFSSIQSHHLDLIIRNCFLQSGTGIGNNPPKTNSISSFSLEFILFVTEQNGIRNDPLHTILPNLLTDKPCGKFQTPKHHGT